MCIIRPGAVVLRPRRAGAQAAAAQGQAEGRQALERAAQQAELALLERIKHELEQDVPIRSQSLTPDELKMLSGYHSSPPSRCMLSPIRARRSGGAAAETEQDLAGHYPDFPNRISLRQAEMELQELSPDEAQEYRDALVATGGAVERLVSESRATAGQISFLTTRPRREPRLDGNPRHPPAPQAAGKVHSDIERGFNPAPSHHLRRLRSCGSEHEARKRGVLRLRARTTSCRMAIVINFPLQCLTCMMPPAPHPFCGSTGAAGELLEQSTNLEGGEDRLTVVKVIPSLDVKDGRVVKGEVRERAGRARISWRRRWHTSHRS
jgi:ribosome-binding ATPase YchF (GTP1/OBG family)